MEEKQDMIRWATFIWNQSPLSFTGISVTATCATLFELRRVEKGFQNHATIMLERLTFRLAISQLRTNNLTSKREHSTKK